MFALDKKVSQMGVIHNYIQKHGDKELTVFAIPFEVLLDPQELCDLRNDEYSHREFFDTQGEVATPLFKDLAEFKLRDDLENAHITLHLGPTGYEMGFEKVKVTKRFIEPLHGGETQHRFTLHLAPQDKQILKLINAQNSEIKLSVSDAKVVENKKRKQRELPLGPDPKADDDYEGEEGSTTTPLTGAHLQRDTTHVYWQQGENGERGNGPRCDMPADCVEIDPPEGSRSEAEQQALQHGESPLPGTMPDVELPPVDDSAEFEAGVAKAVGAHVKRGSKVIDGRSERVKHQDRQRGRDGAH